MEAYKRKGDVNKVKEFATMKTGLLLYTASILHNFGLMKDNAEYDQPYLFSQLSPSFK